MGAAQERERSARLVVHCHAAPAALWEAISAAARRGANRGGEVAAAGRAASGKRSGEV